MANVPFIFSWATDMIKTKVKIRGRKYQLDQHGYLDPPDQWNESFAEGMAIKLGTYNGLTEEHWRFIRYLRGKFTEERIIPFAFQACADNGLRFKRLRYLFPKGYLRGACRTAGIDFSFIVNSNILLTYEYKLSDKEAYKVNERGFLEEFDKWDERFAHEALRTWELPGKLTEKHWEIIYYLRHFFAANRAVPDIIETCMSNSIEIDELRVLFPEGYRRGACRAAGLPFQPGFESGFKLRLFSKKRIAIISKTQM
ncbi:MAG: TusE/DsrC/DsvC family sulfur relay protein [Planctomycetota bacterium]|jgi:tRNA 2-thiouridine synthesizing protein E